jgi:hypothetical protein
MFVKCSCDFFLRGEIAGEGGFGEGARWWKEFRELSELGEFRKFREF